MTGVLYLAIDIAKVKNDVLAEFPDGKRRKFSIHNKLQDFEELDQLLVQYPNHLVGIEPTSNYHRALAYHLKSRDRKVVFTPSLAVARTREAMHNSWDKNDPKDAQVILHLLKTGVTQIFHDPVINNFNDIQELSKTHFLLSLRKTKTQHSILNHYLPLYWPEAQRYYNSSRAEWFFKMLHRYPSPHFISNMSEGDFIKEAWDTVGRKVAKESFLKDLYLTAKTSIGVPVASNSKTIEMFRLVLDEAIRMCQTRQHLEGEAHRYLKDHRQYQILRSIPGIGPIIALTIIAESGDLQRFSHHRKFLKYCGMDLSTHQSGAFRGKSMLSKRGNARLRSALWMAGQVAIRQRENTFRDKYERYIAKDPTNRDLKRKALTAVAAKVARTAFGLVKSDTFYRPYFDEAIPSGGIRSVGP